MGISFLKLYGCVFLSQKKKLYKIPHEEHSVAEGQKFFKDWVS